MPISFLPAVILDAVTDISPALLHDLGIRLLMMDFDNTIVPYTTDVPTQEVSQWLKAMQESGIALCVVSNSKNDRVKIFCDKQTGINLDGEKRDATEIEMSVAKEKLRFFIPKGVTIPGLKVKVNA